MKDLFNNRWFIAALAAGSVALVVQSVAVPLMREPEFADAEPIVEDYLVPQSGESVTFAGNAIQTDAARRPAPQRSGESVLIHRLTWNDTPHRDPFSSRPAKTQSVQATVDTAIPTTPRNYAPPRLDALVAGTSSRFAVLDDQVVSEGDRIGEFRVTRIAKDGVRVSTGIRSVWLPWSKTPKD